MKKQLLFLFTILTIIKASGQDTIYSIAFDYPQPVSFFEDRDTANYFHFNTQLNNIWQIGTPSKIIFNSAFSPAFALLTDTLNTYPNGNISSFEFVIRTDDYTEISFWHRFDTDNLADGGVVEFSTDGGSTWTNIVSSSLFTLTNFYSRSDSISSNGNNPGFTGNSNWIYSTIIKWHLDFVRFRFTFTSDNINTNKDGWMIDDFTFICLPTGTDEIGSNSLFNIFPNPTSNFINIRSENLNNYKRAIIKDIFGKLILVTDKTIIDLSELNTGIYFIEISTDKMKYISRIVRL